MGMQNYVVVELEGIGHLIAFKWGDNREYRYALGDVISWSGRTRPAVADQRIAIGGVQELLASEQITIGDVEYEIPSAEYFRVVVDNDRLISVEAVDENVYRALRSWARQQISDG
ncbi:MAG: hypothetical protein AB7Q23_12210 [Hyphomonadaceae bacterium]